MTSTLALRALRRLRATPGGQLDCRIDFSDGPGASRPVAYVERDLPPGGVPAYLTARESGARAFVLWTDEHRQARVATLVTLTGGRQALFEVLGPRGEPLGRIRRDGAFSRGIRTRWTVSRPGAPDAVGYKGRLFWWCVWWLCTPLLPFVLIAPLLGGGIGGDFPRGPRRIKWRAAGQVPLEFRSSGDTVHLNAADLDWRLGAALVALIPSFDSWIGNPWDSRKD
ncbi:hypothetical protein ACFC0D_03405 [Streptomyces sp. NPDC056222]|uniref:hypothetical protein n=1 Tax=Streptomyces sp. NPDC056222 TaxID=3345749 RepID=UPI0035DAD988